MIQRIQSLYLFIAFILSVLIFSNSLDFLPSSQLVQDYISLKGLLWCPVGLFVTIFLFKKRKFQIVFCWALIFTHLLQLGLFLKELDLNIGLSFALFSVLQPTVGIILLWLAKHHIQKDEVLVRSVDRIR